MLARASYYQYKRVSLGAQDLDRSLGRHIRPYAETRQPIRPKDPTVPRGGGCCKAYRGLGNRSIFYPGSSVGSAITPVFGFGEQVEQRQILFEDNPSSYVLALPSSPCPRPLPQTSHALVASRCPYEPRTP